jgi:hypothetical protein
MGTMRKCRLTTVIQLTTVCPMPRVSQEGRNRIRNGMPTSTNKGATQGSQVPGVPKILDNLCRRLSLSLMVKRSSETELWTLCQQVQGYFYNLD